MSVEVATFDDRRSPGELRKWITTELKKPVLFKGKLNSWNVASRWSVEEVCRALGQDKITTFKVCPKRESLAFHKLFSENEVVFETQCSHVQATFTDFWEWMNSTESLPSQEAERLPEDTSEPLVPDEPTKRLKLDKPEQRLLLNPLLRYPRRHHWIYADYKYMSELCGDRPELLSAIDWGVFGFEGRGGKDSTLWVGSEGACTPCHYDTYGCNLIGQLWGRKRWVMFAPEDSEKLYPTRVPYEESSVFSSVNVLNPDLDTYPKFSNTTAYDVTLSPGEVLLVPRHWWHYVECLEPAVSVNTWIELPSDVEDRVKEGIVRTLVSLCAAGTQESVAEELLNPNEVAFPLEENLQLLSLVMRERREQLGQPSPIGELTAADFINVITSDAVVDCVAKQLLHSCTCKSTV